MRHHGRRARRMRRPYVPLGKGNQHRIPGEGYRLREPVSPYRGEQAFQYVRNGLLRVQRPSHVFRSVPGGGLSQSRNQRVLSADTERYWGYVELELRFQPTRTHRCRNREKFHGFAKKLNRIAWAIRTHGHDFRRKRHALLRKRRPYRQNVRMRWVSVPKSRYRRRRKGHSHRLSRKDEYDPEFLRSDRRSENLFESPIQRRDSPKGESRWLLMKNPRPKTGIFHLGTTVSSTVRFPAP